MFNKVVHEKLTSSVLTELLDFTALYDKGRISAEEAKVEFDVLGIKALESWEATIIDDVICVADITANEIKTAQGVTVHDVEESVKEWLKLLYQG